MSTMVNTFITSTDYKKCAQNLNSQRLGKQRVEAMQLLHILQDAHFVAKRKKISFPQFQSNFSTSPKEIASVFKARCKWLDDVIALYKKLNYIYIKRKSDNKIFKLGKEYKKKVDKQKFRILLGGFSSHVAAKMWCGYETSLKIYINQCIHEWKKRGFQNNMEIYKAEDGEAPLWINEKPWWITKTDLIINSHKTALLRKETERGEEPWYWKKKDFTKLAETDFYEYGYIWPSRLTEEQIVQIIETQSNKFFKPPHLSELCDRIEYVELIFE